MVEPILKFDHVSKNFIPGQGFAGIKNVSFDIGEGEIVSVLGPSGCGKTTIIRLISSLIKPSQGKIWYKNTDIISARLNRVLGLVSQFPALLLNRNVENNIKLPLEVLSLEDPDEVKKIIELVGLGDIKEKYPYQLSGGQKQRVIIARALVYKPEVLLMDEPFSSLDEMMREKLNLELIKISRKLNITVFFVTHNIEEAVFISDRIFILSDNPGQLVGEIQIDLPVDRNIRIKNTDKFFDYLKTARQLLKFNNNNNHI